ncbi:MAG TPA: 1,6-dihydroxycyclohexa-2,4-diene-1-carboxylate dehydrogenase [Burkholderiaceae bacterium]|jgi:dihydroxycyclohexadiene carboxylate dehydrogenase
MPASSPSDRPSERPSERPSTHFAGKVAIVTGAAQGLGRDVALRLAREGAAVIVADHDERHCHAVVREIVAQAGTAQAFVADLEAAEGARRLVAQAIGAFGRVDIAVHNVGGTIWSKPFWEYEERQIEKEINRSLWPTLWGCHAVIPHMIERGSGAIVNIGSVAVKSRFRVPYAAAKGGVHAMTVCIAHELRDCGVRINCVAPGGIDAGVRKIPRNPDPLSRAELAYKTEMTAETHATTPLGRYGRPEEVSSAVCYLASDEASYITGQVLYVAGGGHG